MNNKPTINIKIENLFKEIKINVTKPCDIKEIKVELVEAFISSIESAKEISNIESEGYKPEKVEDKPERLGDDNIKKTIVYEIKVDDTQLKEALENITNKIEKVTDQQLRLKCLDIVSKDKEVPVLAYKVHADALFNYIKEGL